MVSFACQVPIPQKDNELAKERGNLLVAQLSKCHIQTLLAGGSTEVTWDRMGPVYERVLKVTEVVDESLRIKILLIIKK